ncbi:MAG TPA: hypothetical protein VF414_05885 [Thermoanaerobaculia bacterium]
MSPAPTLSDLRAALAEIQTRFEERVGRLSDELAETRAEVKAHSRLFWGLSGILGFLELLNLVLPHGLRGLF